jgi:uncharacterized membrane protein YqaE (UPF0057 family)
MGWNEMVDAILSLKDFAFNLINIIVKLIKVFPKFLSIFTYILDPKKLISDIIYAIVTGAKMIYEATIGYLIGSFMKNFYLDSKNKNKKTKKGGEKCFNKSLINVLILILCPPLAIFMNEGISSILYIIIASVLTYFYYFPGLIYSCLYIL